MERAVGLGSYFSANAAMKREQIAALPRERALTETDFPAKRARARKPGDTRAIESMLSSIWDSSPDEVRMQLYRNLRTLALQAGCLGQLPEPLADLLAAA